MQEKFVHTNLKITKIIQLQFVSFFEQKSIEKEANYETKYCERL